MEDIKLGRRQFLKSGGAVAAAAGATFIPIHDANAAKPASNANTTLDYPRKSLGKTSGLPVNQAVAFNYPDEYSPCYVIRTGRPVPGGIGPDGDIVAYSAMCTHMGCPVGYDADSRTLKCACHFSMFDPENGGQMVCGQATEDLPQILLEHDTKTDTVRAIGVDGLIFGRQSNVL